MINWATDIIVVYLQASILLAMLPRPLKEVLGVALKAITKGGPEEICHGYIQWVFISTKNKRHLMEN